VASVNQRDSSVMGLPGGCGGRWLGCGLGWGSGEACGGGGLTRRDQSKQLAWRCSEKRMADGVSIEGLLDAVGVRSRMRALLVDDAGGHKNGGNNTMAHQWFHSRSPMALLMVLLRSSDDSLSTSLLSSS
jgi:hypothetical protein